MARVNFVVTERSMFDVKTPCVGCDYALKIRLAWHAQLDLIAVIAATRASGEATLGARGR